MSRHGGTAGRVALGWHRHIRFVLVRLSIDYRKVRKAVRKSEVGTTQQDEIFDLIARRICIPFERHSEHVGIELRFAETASQPVRLIPGRTTSEQSNNTE